MPLYELITDFYAAIINDYLHIYTAIIIVVTNWHEMLSYKLHLMLHSFFIVTANCLLLGSHVLIVMGALQIYIDDDDDDDTEYCQFANHLVNCVAFAFFVITNYGIQHSIVKKLAKSLEIVN